MLELIKQELTESGVSPTQFISINFEDMNYSHLQTARALHDEITQRAAAMKGKVYLFFDEIQEVKDWEKCINSFRVSLNCDIYITGSNAKLLSGELATYLDVMWSLSSTHSHLGNLWSCTVRLSPMKQARSVSKSTCLPEVCLILRISNMQTLHPGNIFMTCSTRSSSRTL